MDNEPRHSLTLLAAACLTFCGVAVLAVGIGMGGVPLQRSVCLSLAPNLCCTGATAQTAAMPPVVSLSTLHAITILQD
jgi:hypothetical protein